jgi:xanthine dehydrogenase large subunit
VDGSTPGGGRNAGLLMTHAPSTYKIPTANDIPAVFNTALFENNSNPADSIHRSKAVGEPPLLLGFSAFLAIRDAIASTCTAAGPAGWAPPLRAPATPEAVLDALAAAPAAATATPSSSTPGP